MADVQIYLTTYCSYCTRAKALLQRKGVPFREINVDNDPAKRTWLREQTGQQTVPQIFIDGRGVGGCDDLHALDRAGELDRLLGRSPPSP